MRAHEFINETREFSDRKSSTLSTAFNYPSMPSASPYLAYRFGVAMANHEIKNNEGPAGQGAVVVAYTVEEEQIIKAAERKTGHRGNMLADRGSHEPNSTATLSPVASTKRNKHGV
jgi:hypothetical protein